MTPDDLLPTAYESPDGSLRVVRDGVYWRAERWCTVAHDWQLVVRDGLGWWATAYDALYQLGLLDDGPDRHEDISF